MKDRKLATRYARALLEALPDATAKENTDQFLDALRESMAVSVEFRDLLLDPAAPRAKRKSALRAIAERYQLPRQVTSFLDVVVEHNRTANLPSMAVVFHEEWELEQGVVAAEITTAVPLSPDAADRARRALESRTGKKIRLSTRVDPALVGGALTKVGSTVYDGSLRTQLQQLRRRMLQE